MMKKYTLLFLFMVLGVSPRVYGQEQTKRVIPKHVNFFNQFIPVRDTVIMRGEEIEVGAYFARKDKDRYEEVIEIKGFGRSKKSDVDKGYFVLKLKPKQMTKYEIEIEKQNVNAPPNFKRADRRIVYVAKTEEERKKLQEDIDSKRKALREQMKKGGARLDKFDVR